MRSAITMAVAICFVLTGEALAQGDLVFLRDGSVFRGKVLESSWESVKVSRKTETGEETLTIPVAKVDAHFFYRVRDKALGDDAAGRIQLARYAVENDLLMRAKVQMDLARSLDPEVVTEFYETTFPKIKEGIAETILKAGQRALRRGSTKNAKTYASIILTKFEGTKAEPGAEKLLDEVEKKIAEAEAKRRAQRERSAKSTAKREEPAAEGGAEKILAPIEKRIDEAERSNVRGLRAKGLSEARTSFEAAATKYLSARSLIAKRRQGDIADKGVVEALDYLEAMARDGAVQAYLNLAAVYASRGSYPKATELTNKALAVDPASSDAKAARAGYATAGGGWGIRRGGRR